MKIKKVLLVLMLMLSVVLVGCQSDDQDELTQAEIRGLNDYAYQLEQEIDELESKIESLEATREWTLDYLRDLEVYLDELEDRVETLENQEVSISLDDLTEEQKQELVDTLYDILDDEIDETDLFNTIDELLDERDFDEQVEDYIEEYFQNMLIQFLEEVEEQYGGSE